MYDTTLWLSWRPCIFLHISVPWQCKVGPRRSVNNTRLPSRHKGLLEFKGDAGTRVPACSCTENSTKSISRVVCRVHSSRFNDVPARQILPLVFVPSASNRMSLLGSGSEKIGGRRSPHPQKWTLSWSSTEKETELNYSVTSKAIRAMYPQLRRPTLRSSEAYPSRSPKS
jgi:hypothetical protein